MKFMRIDNEWGCFGGTPKPQAAPPPPAAAPTPLPEQPSPTAANDAQQAQLQMLRFGIASTIKTSPSGITGGGSNLNPMYQTGKQKLGQ